MKWWMPDNGTAAVGIHNEAGKWLSDAAYRVGADRLVAAHNADIDALTAEVDELQRRCEQAESDKKQLGERWQELREQLDAIYAIAEGREG